MKFSSTLIGGILIKRIGRFLIDVKIDPEYVQSLPKSVQVKEDGRVLAHCANTAAMKKLQESGNPVLLSISANAARKHPLTWEMAKVDKTWVGAHTSHPPVLVQEAIAQKRIPGFEGYDDIQAEVPYGTRSRIDLLLQGNGLPPCYIEVKNVHMKRESDIVLFPDSVTQRGVKHLHELGEEVKKGNRAVIFFVAQRSDCKKFQVAADIDPDFNRAFKDAISIGVEAFAYSCKVTPQEIVLSKKLKICT